MAKVGFIGLGNMGGPMAANLIKAGHDIKVYDLVDELIKPLVEQGAVAVDEPKALCENVDFLISMLPSGLIVENLFIDETHLLDFLAKETLVIDCSTVSAQTSLRVAEYAVTKGVQMIDAPVSGGTGGAQAGTLTFICGGEEQAIEKSKAVLSDMGKNIFRAGDSGAGQVAKICNNMLLAIHMAGTAEALQMGMDNGLDPKVLSDIMLQSSGRNWSLELYNPVPGVMDNVPASNEYQGGFMVNLMLKDLGLAQTCADSSNSDTPLGSIAHSLYQDLKERDMGNLDFSAIQRLYQK